MLLKNVSDINVSVTTLQRRLTASYLLLILEPEGEQLRERNHLLVYSQSFYGMSTHTTN